MEYYPRKIEKELDNWLRKFGVEKINKNTIFAALLYLMWLLMIIG